MSCRFLPAPVIESIVMLPETVPVLITELPASVRPPKAALTFGAKTVPSSVVTLAVLVIPPLNLSTSPPSPSVTPPVFENVTAFWISDPLPRRLTV